MSTFDLEEFVATGSTGFKLGARDEKWDGGAAEKSYDLPDDAACYMWRAPDGDASKKCGSMTYLTCRNFESSTIASWSKTAA